MIRPKSSFVLAAVLTARLRSGTAVMSAISGRKRRNVLIASQACMIVALALLLLVHLLAAGAALAWY